MKRMATDKEPMSTAFHLALEEMAVVASWNKNETTQRYRLLFSRASNPCATNKMIWEPERLQRSPGLRTQPTLPAVPRCSSNTAEGLIVGEDPGAGGTEGERAHRLDVLQVRFPEKVDQTLCTSTCQLTVVCRLPGYRDYMLALGGILEASPLPPPPLQPPSSSPSRSPAALHRCWKAV